MENIQASYSSVKNKFYNIDFLRFIFCILIIYFHITNNSSIKNIFILEANKCWNAYIIVEFFFIIAGFFLFQTVRNKDESLIQFVIKKIIRLWPALAFFSIITMMLIRFLNVNFKFAQNISDHFINLFFLQNVGLTSSHGGFNWFISAYFWVIIFYFYILKNFESKYANLIIALCVYFSLVGNLNYIPNFTLRGLVTYNYFFNSGVLRALAGMGIGYFIGILYNKIKTRKFNNLKVFTIFSIIEILCCLFLIKYLLFSSNIRNALILIIVFSILFLLLLIKNGVVSRVLNNKYFASSGKYSYSIYVMQGIVFILLDYTIWKNTYFISNPALCLFISLILATLTGIFTYYFIEKPSIKYLKNKFKI